MNRKGFSLIVTLAFVLLAACAAPARPQGEAATATQQPTSAPVAVAPAGGINNAPAPTAENAGPIPFSGDTPVLTLHREGGIAGFCDDSIINADGSYTTTTCGAQPGKKKTGQLDSGQLQQLSAWVNQFKSFDASEGQGAADPDAMLLKTTFKGAGAVDAGPENKTAVTSFAMSLLAPPAPAGSSDNSDVASKAQDFLAAELNISVDGISLVSIEPVQWPDRCLGVVIMGQMCAQGVTPGYKVILQASGQTYELHTDQTGESIREVRPIPQ